MAKFKARARTIDMLGRQQIQGIPTALHELFKNAHDAYADNVEVDFYRKSNILLLRDDGIGMTREDFESRWLTIGTESKYRKRKGDPALNDPSKKPRAVMGEKGIGRLAIAAIGPQVLILTRPKRDGVLGNITVSFINWGVFELPGIDLDDIEIPVEEIHDIGLVTSEFVLGMVDNFKDQIEKLPIELDDPILLRIKEELDSFNVPVEQLTNLSNGPSLRSTVEGGTQFLIFPVNDSLPSDIDVGFGKVNKKETASNLERSLLGFTYSVDDSREIPIHAEFRDHLIDGQVLPRIGASEFMTLKEYEIADHHVKGHFDEFGNFKGEVKIYDQPYVDIEILAKEAAFKLDCGPFDLNFAYVQGKKDQTMVPPQEWAQLTNKLDKIGGLYIYKDGIRVLPYGNSDYDFLEIERRRTFSAKYYFFSYRRMFGTLDLTSDFNSNLSEKAGREGYQNNKAYRHFRKVLMDFFEELAAKFFREDGAYAEEWTTKRSFLQNEYKKAEKRKKTASGKKSAFSKSLNAFFERIEGVEFDDEFQLIVEEHISRMQKLIESENISEIAQDIIAIEIEASEALKDKLEEYNIPAPKGFGLTKDNEKLWRSYSEKLKDEINPAYFSAVNQLQKTIGKVAQDAKLHLDMQVRLQASIDHLRVFSEKKVKDEQKAAREALTDTKSYVDGKLSDTRKLLDATKTEINKRIQELSKVGLTAETYPEIQQQLEMQLDDVSENMRQELELITRQLKRVDISSSKDNILTDEDAVSALETELEMLRDDYSESLEMAQMGMAVSVVHHEFESNVKAVRDSLGALHGWANKNQNLKLLYERMRNGFDHLDNYLSLFTPLDKRLRRRKTRITGEAIGDFVRDLFGEKAQRHDVEIELADGFSKHHIVSHASVVYPVFVNLVDNAFYWLSNKQGVRKIILSATQDGFAITDNGPGISSRDLPHIFDFGYTRKLGGRGMGLYIARTSLNKEGFDLVAENEMGMGAKFIVRPLEK